MPHQLIDRSADLKRLRDEGFDLEIRSGFLLVKDVPYVTPNRKVKRGTIVTALTLAGDKTTKPTDHVVEFTGETPCDHTGAALNRVIIESARRQIADNLVVNHRFSSKPLTTGVYPDYYEKITAYIAILESFARVIDPAASARTFPVVREDGDESPFAYVDTATSRAAIGVAVRKLQLAKLASVGLGGTGGYILDLVAKTPVREIHLFDGDVFLSHNAFRAPGAASVATLESKLMKVDYYARTYLEMHRGVQPHPYYLDATNVSELKNMDFAFLAIDAGESKRIVVEALEAFHKPFIDVGIGITQVDDALTGLVRVTSSVPEKRDHFRERVSLGASAERGIYDQNIQIAELNALNAALAVVRWKKFCGFYLDFESEFHSTFSIDCNVIANDDSA